MSTTLEILAKLYGLRHDAEELALAAHLLVGGPPTDLAEFLDFFVVEWVDAEGYTAVQRAVEQGHAPTAALRLSRECRRALWVVDDWDSGTVMLRDLATEAEASVWAPGRERDLPKRTVLLARVLPEVSVPDRYVFSGSPDVYDGLGVIARLDLLRDWQNTPEPDLHARLAALRAAFEQQREEHDAFGQYFGKDALVFANADALSAGLSAFMSFLGNTFRFESLGGKTRAEAHKHSKGDEPKVTQIALGESLRGPGQPGVHYDRVRGVHFLPNYGELLAGDAEVRALYLSEPGLAPFVTGWQGRAVPSTLPWDD